jgi:hypothetical protein
MAAATLLSCSCSCRRRIEVHAAPAR